MIHKTLFAVAFSFFICNLLQAQPFNLKKEIKPTELKLIDFNPKSDANKKGRINVTKVVQVKDTAYYFCKKISIYSPVVVSIGVQDPANPIQISLHKWNWKQPSRTPATTNEKGYWEARFSTEMDFGIKIIAPNKPAVYNIYVWVGNEVTPKIASPFKEYVPSKGGGLFSGKNIIIALVALVLLAITFLFFKKKKMKTGTLILIVLFTFSGNLFAQLDENIFDGVDHDYANPGSIPLNGDDFVEQNSPPSGESATSEFANASSALEIVNNFAGAITTAAGIISAGSDLWEAWQLLDNDECVPDFSQPANALMPSSCNDESGCNECYTQALGKFNADRKTLARMWCIYMNTKNFTDKAIAFGNSMASLPGGVGLGWIPAKKQIDGAYTNIKNTYDKKSRELLTSLQKNMMAINECENQYGLKDWYQKFGFMYFEFMQQKYKRPD